MKNILFGTGHRSQDLPCKFVRKHPWKLAKLKQIQRYLEDNNFDKVISGFAIGLDQWLAHISIKVGVPLIAYIPFEGQENLWPDDHRKQFHELLNKASEVKYVCEPGYAAWKMHRRNEAMIRDSTHGLALWNPEKRKGGTFSAVSHAFSVGRPMMNFWTDPEKPIEFF